MRKKGKLLIQPFSNICKVFRETKLPFEEKKCNLPTFNFSIKQKSFPLFWLHYQENNRNLTILIKQPKENLKSE